MNYTRAHFAAKGVDSVPGSLKEVLLYKYFEKERMLRFKETMFLAAASLGDSEAIKKALKAYQSELFPEVELDQKDFEEESLKKLEKLQEKAFVITQTNDGYTELMAVDRKDISEVRRIEEEFFKEGLQELRERHKRRYGEYPTSF